jgi:hypothetical protein
MASIDSGRGRRVAALGLVALSAVLLLLGIFAVWLNRQALNTDNWTETSSELLEQENVRSQLAARLTDAVFASVDVEQALRDVLPPRAEVLGPPVANAFRTQVEATARRALARPEFQERWADANRAAHRQLLAVLDDGGTTVSTAEGVVVLDLSQLLAELQARVGVGGRLRRALPESATQITLLRSDELRTAQNAVTVLRPLPVVLLLAALALLAVAIVIAPSWRRQAVRAFGVALVAAGLAALLIRSLAGDAFVSSLASTAAAEPTVATVWSIATELLGTVAVAAIGYGVVIVAAVSVAGPTKAATAVRRAAAPYLREPAIAYSVLLVAVAGLVWWAPTPAWRDVAMVLILAGLLAAGVEALRRQVIREFPELTREDAVRRHRERWARFEAAIRERGRALRASATARNATVAELASPDDDRISQLERLAQLRQAGILDDDELRAEKRRILQPDGGDAVIPAGT